MNPAYHLQAASDGPEFSPSKISSATSATLEAEPLIKNVFSFELNLQQDWAEAAVPFAQRAPAASAAGQGKAA